MNFMFSVQCENPDQIQNHIFKLVHITYIVEYYMKWVILQVFEKKLRIFLINLDPILLCMIYFFYSYLLLPGLHKVINF